MHDTITNSHDNDALTGTPNNGLTSAMFVFDEHFSIAKANVRKAVRITELKNIKNHKRIIKIILKIDNLLDFI